MNKLSKVMFGIYLIFFSSFILGQNSNIVSVDLGIKISGSGSYGDLFVSKDKSIYITDEERGAIYLLDNTGNLMDNKDLKGQVKDISTSIYPTLVSVNESGEVLTYDSKNNFLAKFKVNLTFPSRGAFEKKQIKQVIDIFQSSDGYLYALDKSDKAIKIFNPDGMFVSSIYCRTIAVDEPVAIYPAKDNSIYILDKSKSSLINIDQNGNLLSVPNTLLDDQSKAINDASDFIVLASGQVKVVNKEGVLYHYNQRFELTKQELLSPGSSDGFKMSMADRLDADLAILDKKRGVLLLYKVDNKPMNLVSTLKIKFSSAEVAGRVNVAGYLANDGMKVFSPATNQSHIIGVNSEGEIVFQNKNTAKKVTAIEGNGTHLYVLDSEKKIISKFDLQGNLITQFGQNLEPKLKDPTGMVLLDNATILVSDKSRGELLAYNFEGKYMNSISFPEIKKPAGIGVNGKSEVFIWDEASNAIYLIDPVRARIGKDILRVRGSDFRSRQGEIGGMVMDPVGQLIIFNKTNEEIDIYRWADKPEVVAHYRNPVDEGTPFDGITNMWVDPSNYQLHLVSDNNDESVYQFEVEPPSPENLYRFEAKGNELLVYYKPVISSFVSHYGLLLNNDDGSAELAYTTPKDLSFTISENKKEGNLDKANRYLLVSMNPGSMSKPTTGFDNFFGQGIRNYNNKQYDKAALAFQKALKYMGRHESMVRVISDIFLVMGLEKISNFDAYEGLDYLQSAYYLAPASQQCAIALANGYKTVFWKLASQNNFKDIVSMTEEEVDDPFLENTLLSTIDSISTVFGRLPNFSALKNAKLLRDKLIDWQPNNPKFHLGLGEVSISLFEKMRNSGMPQIELNILSFEAEQSFKKAYDLYGNDKRKKLEALFGYLNILEKRGKFKDLEKTVEKTLASESTKLSEKEDFQIRTFLARSYAGQEDFAQAINQYEHLIGDNPEDKNLQRSLADVYLKNGNTQDAKAIYQKLLIEQRDNSLLTGNIGLIELAERNYVEASYQLERALKLDPNSLIFRGPLGEAFENSGNVTKAIENYVIAIDYYRANKGIRSDRSLEFATPISNRDQLIAYLFKLADLYYKTGEYNFAIQSYEEILSIDEASHEAWYGLGKASLSAGLVYDAMKSFFEAKTIEPGLIAYNNAYQDAIKLRDQVAKNEEPLKLASVEVEEVFPSLYRNYGITNKLPMGNATISNNTGIPINSASMTVYIPGIMTGPTSQDLGTMLAYSNTTIPLKTVFTEKILNSTETKTYQATIKLDYVFQNKNRTVEKSIPVTVYGRNHISWSDKRKLASFVSPNVNDFINFSRKMDQELKDDLSYEIITNLNKAIQVYSVLNNNGMSYAPDPNLSFSEVSNNSQILDFLQYPAETLKRKSGDCDDLVALFCSVLENAGVPTGYVDIPGHVFMALNLQITSDQLLYSGIPSDLVILHNSEAWIPIETTMIGEANFEEAWRQGAKQYRETINKNQFPELIPLEDARSAYVPSNYEPANFSSIPTITPDMKNEYSSQLSKIMIVTNEGILREMENQYKNETSNIFVKNKFGILLAKTGNLERAKKIFQEAYALVPSNPSVLNNLGNIAYAEKEYMKALNYYLKSVTYDDSDIQSMINVSKTYNSMNQKDKAIEWFNKAKTMDINVTQYFQEYQNQLK
jgi:tetratricopeptide (TPR) repeat protein